MSYKQRYTSTKNSVLNFKYTPSSRPMSQNELIFLEKIFK